MKMIDANAMVLVCQCDVCAWACVSDGLYTGAASMFWDRHCLSSERKKKTTTATSLWYRHPSFSERCTSVLFEGKSATIITKKYVDFVNFNRFQICFFLPTIPVILVLFPFEFQISSKSFVLLSFYRRLIMFLFTHSVRHCWIPLDW